MSQWILTLCRDINGADISGIYWKDVADKVQQLYEKATILGQNGTSVKHTQLLRSMFELPEKSSEILPVPIPRRSFVENKTDFSLNISQMEIQTVLKSIV